MGQSDLKAVHEREVFPEKYKRARPTGRKAHRPPRVFLVRIEKLRSDWRSKLVRQMCSDWEVFESKGV